MTSDNDTLRNKPFGGKIVLFGGDFRQVLPVVGKGTRRQTVDACINRSARIWPPKRLFRLHANMRVQRMVDSGADDGDVRDHQEFAQRLLRIGDGTEPCQQQDGHDVVRLPPSVCCNSGSLEDLVDRVYVGWEEPRISEQWRDFVVQRAILAPTNEAVHEVADVALRRIRWVPAGAHRLDVPTTSYSAESVVESEQRQFYPVEFLNSLNFPRVPPHAITLATGTPVVLIRNLTQGLKNGTRMIVRSVTTTLLTVELRSGPMAGQTTYIPRLAITPPTPHPTPSPSDDVSFRFCRRMP